MPTKSRNILADQDINYLSRVKVKNSGFTAGTAATYIGKHEIVTVDGSSSSGAYIEVDEAIAGIALEEQDLWVTVHEIREFGAVTRWALVELDTSAASIGDAVYLSATTAGAITLTASPRRVGTVVVAATVANGGLCLVDPVAHQASSGAAAIAWSAREECFGPTGADPVGWTFNAGTDAEAVDAVVDTAQAGGVWVIVTGNLDGTTAADGSGIVWDDMPIQLDSAGGDTYIEARVRIKAALTFASVGFGLTDSTALEEPFTNSADTVTTTATDACGFLYDTDATTDNWWACAVDTDVDDVHATTGSAPVADAWQILRMEIANDGATIRFYVDGALTNTLSAAGVGPDVVLYPYVIANTTAGTPTSRSVDVDYIEVGSIR